MMIPIAGTIRNAVKLAELDNKWQQRKKNAGKDPAQAADPQIRQFQEDLQRMRENNQMASISAKLKAGAGLTSEEVKYLQKNSPELYREYLEVRNEKEAYERQLKACKTKEEAERLKINKMGRFMAEVKGIMSNGSIPEDKKLELIEKLQKRVMGVQTAHMAFVESAEYQELPSEEEIFEQSGEDIKDIPENIENAENTGIEIVKGGGNIGSPEFAEAGKNTNNIELAGEGKNTGSAGFARRERHVKSAKNEEASIPVSKLHYKFHEVETAIANFTSSKVSMLKDYEYKTKTLK
ncbi:hypothetical protein EDD76_10993 [Kineothrix alysoides]|uniref:Uncharacterized protein n=1 Tax=Kineothrix alysoides TaxID=1469948 RepID=A0A4R1QVR5_9FIRM|nr:hypothetical protein [Kineothrix alysoides]TCL57231.1 hypothetical protein EDD76_10993 [Kineothrix alysoides]